MANSKEIKTLLFSVGICLTLLGGAGWWIFRTVSQSPSTAESQSSAIAPTNNPKTLAEVSSIPSGVFRYGGSTTWSLIRAALLDPIQAAHPQFQLTYADPWSGSPGSRPGVKMLLQNQLSFSLSSNSITDEEHSQAKDRGFSLTEVPVAIDGYAIAVHHDLSVSGLTMAQVNQLQSKQYRNWQEVGGPDLPIHYYSKDPAEADQPHITVIKTTTEAVRQLATNPAGVYWASAPLLVAQCSVKTLPLAQGDGTYISPAIPPGRCPTDGERQVNTTAFQDGSYPLTRRLTVVIKQDGSPDQAAGEAYAELLLTDEGQSLIRSAGFVSLR